MFLKNAKYINLKDKLADRSSACYGFVALIAKFISYLVLLMWLPTSLNAASSFYEIELIIENNRFTPEIIHAPEGQKIRITVHNKDKTIEEFESFDLKREKMVPGGGKARIILAPLKAGEYKFFGEFHEDTAQGKLIVKPLKDHNNYKEGN